MALLLLRGAAFRRPCWVGVWIDVSGLRGEDLRSCPWTRGRRPAGQTTCRCRRPSRPSQSLHSKDGRRTHVMINITYGYDWQWPRCSAALTGDFLEDGRGEVPQKPCGGSEGRAAERSRRRWQDAWHVYTKREVGRLLRAGARRLLLSTGGGAGGVPGSPRPRRCRPAPAASRLAMSRPTTHTR